MRVSVGVILVEKYLRYKDEGTKKVDPQPSSGNCSMTLTHRFGLTPVLSVPDSCDRSVGTTCAHIMPCYRGSDRLCAVLRAAALTAVDHAL